MQENHSSQEHQDQESEEERNSPEKEERLIVIQESTHLQEDRYQLLNKDVTITLSSERVWKPPTIGKDDFSWMDNRKMKP
jgi:hypothetical protein